MKEKVQAANLAQARKQGKKMWKRQVRKFFNNRLAVFGLIVILIYLFGAVFADVLAPYDPVQPDFGNKLASPSAEHIFGCDNMGRDLFSRALYGARTSMLIGVLSAVICNAIGVVLGSVCGYLGGFIDKVIVRLSEIVNCFPQMILILIMMTFIEPGASSLIIIYGLTGWTGTFRMVRAEFFARREETYIKACEAFGMSNLRIIFTQILPSVMTLVIIQATMSIPNYVMGEAGLSFLGFGVPKTTPTWGTMLNAATNTNVLLNYPHVWLVPGVLMSLFVLSVNFLGDGLRDVMDPRQQ